MPSLQSPDVTTDRSPVCHINACTVQRLEERSKVHLPSAEQRSLLEWATEVVKKRTRPRWTGLRVWYSVGRHILIYTYTRARIGAGGPYILLKKRNLNPCNYMRKSAKPSAKGAR